MAVLDEGLIWVRIVVGFRPEILYFSFMSTKSPEQALSDYTEGDFELSPVELSLSSGRGDEYPLVHELRVPVDVSQLRRDFEAVKGQLSNRYLSERAEGLRLPIEDIKEILKSLGFSHQHYQAMGLMKIGTSQLLDHVPEYTKSVLKNFSPYCRAHYVIAQPGLEVARHVDCENYKLHGFRIHIPIYNSAFYSFYQNEVQKDFELTPGKAWFVNNAVPHTARNGTDEPRVSILLQAMSDSNLNSLGLSF